MDSQGDINIRNIDIGMNSFIIHVNVLVFRSRGSTLRISQTQGPTESLESVNLNMEELTRQLRAQNRQVSVGTDERTTAIQPDKLRAIYHACTV